MTLGNKYHILNHKHKRLICISLHLFSLYPTYQQIGKNKEHNKLIFVDKGIVIACLNSLYIVIMKNKDLYSENTLNLTYSHYPNSNRTVPINHNDWRYICRKREDIWELVNKLIR